MGNLAKNYEIYKVDTGLGLIFGFAIVCKRGGEDYYDLQGDHIPEDAMMEASCDFMMSKRVGGVMHRKDGNKKVLKGGDIIYAFPLTTDIAKSLNISTDQTGLLVAYKPADPDTLKKAENGEFTGFSIGGGRIEDEEV